MPGSSKNLALAILCGVPLIMVLGNSMLIPILPTMKSVLHVSQFQISLMITMFSIPAGIIIPLAGFLSDRVPRKAVIAVSLLIYGLGGIIAGCAAVFLKDKAYTVILAGRIVQGIGAAGTAPIAMALSSDLFTGKSRAKALGLIEASNGMGKVLSPILGSLLALITWYAVFFSFPILCVPLSLAAWFLIKEPSGKKKKAKGIKEYFQSLGKIFHKKGKFLLANFLAGAVALFILFGVLFYLSNLLEEKYKIEGVLKGAVLAIPLLAMCTTSYTTGSYIKKKAGLMKFLICLGLGLVAVSTGLAAFLSNTYILIGALVFTGIGSGLVLPCLNTLITSSISIEERGMVTALYGSVRFLGVAIGPPVFGLLEKNKLLMFGSISVLALVTGLVIFFVVTKKDLQTIQKGAQKSDSSANQQ